MSERPLNISLPETEPSHFDHLIDEAEEIEQEQEKETAQSFMLRAEDFRLLWVKGFAGASMLTGIKSLKLPNAHVDLDAAYACADAIYETILDVPALHFMLNPGNKWFERAFVVGLFGMGMKNAILAEGRERQKTPQTVRRQPQKSHDSGDLTPDQAAALTGVS